MRRVLVGAATVLALSLLLVCAAVAHRELLAVRRAAEGVDPHVMVPAPKVARIVTLGYGELAADLVWVRTLVYYGDGLVHHTGMPDVEKLLDLLFALDPAFRYPYVWGAYATIFRNPHVTQEEYRSSVAILRRGVAHFPDDWELARILGERLFFDLKPADPAEQERNRNEGASLMEHAMHLPHAPATLARTAASMRTILGQKQRALRELREMILVTEDAAARAELLARYAELSQEATSALAEESRAFEAEWKQVLPYVPASLYILIGPPPPPGVDLGAMLAPEN